MRRAIGQSLRIGVSGFAVSLLRVSRWRGEPVTVLAEHAFAPSGEHPFDAIANALRALLGEQEVGGWPVSIVLADDLTRLWRVVPPPDATRLADIEAAAGFRFQSLYGESPSAWQISGDWSATQPFFAAAVPRALLAVLGKVAEEFKLHIVGIEPHFITAYNRWRRGLKAGAWFALVHDHLLTLAAIEADGKSIRAIRTLPMPAGQGADQYWLGQTIKREALLLDMEAPELLQVCGAAPAAWSKPVTNPAHIACAVLDQSQQASSGGLSTMALMARGGSAA
ncbi:hypothetical protein D0T25_25105 [Duganella sp. BJB488]|uniref:hypothetical protein n=1 Tax=unclassified Duganella TaxID=2636909 RepID=UPI000E34F010|nr:MULTISPECIES: hypothetical protein [unclassified Duganella]RFP12364.1 hypothetical protein D0T26_24050 [Duganella sp. BJB489]RFP16542.1 hypothetical protein D0T25_25105 [Duganella sp. BJB488]RFP30728.1 hypothetical protein D0T24_25395 [Duganella sp. BJB480]